MARSKGVPALLLTLLLLAGSGCDAAETPAPPVFTEEALSNTSYHFVGLDGQDAVVLLGELSFAERQGADLSGSWALTTWGEQAHFSSLPGNGSFTGLIHGDLAILRIDLAEAGESLGLVVEGFRENRLVGSLRLLPGAKFDGRFEAIAQQR